MCPPPRSRTMRSKIGHCVLRQVFLLRIRHARHVSSLPRVAARCAARRRSCARVRRTHAVVGQCRRRGAIAHAHAAHAHDVPRCVGWEPRHAEWRHAACCNLDDVNGDAARLRCRDARPSQAFTLDSAAAMRKQCRHKQIARRSRQAREDEVRDGKPVASHRRRFGALRRRARARRRDLSGQRRRDLRPDRPERRRQDHAVQLHHAALLGRERHDLVRGRAHRHAFRRARSSRSASRARSRTSASIRT